MLKEKRESTSGSPEFVLGVAFSYLVLVFYLEEQNQIIFSLIYSHNNIALLKSNIPSFLIGRKTLLTKDFPMKIDDGTTFLAEICV